MLTWSSWHNLEDRSGYSGPAVYKIRLLVGGRAPRVPRFLASDAEGLLAIGMTGNMRNRHRQFLRGLWKGRGHSEANLLHQLVELPSYQLRHSGCEYQYRFTRLQTRDQADMLEERLLKEYLRTFGELPPLNSTIPDRYAGR